MTFAVGRGLGALFIFLMVVMISWESTYVPVHKAVHLNECDPLCQLYVNKVANCRLVIIITTIYLYCLLFTRLTLDKWKIRLLFFLTSLQHILGSPPSPRSAFYQVFWDSCFYILLL